MAKAPAPNLLFRVLLRFGLGSVLMMALLFVPAGTWRYWQAWLYCGVLFTPMLVVVAIFFKKDPALLDRRLRTREQEKPQRKLTAYGNAVFLVGLLVPGLDYRFGWSHVPTWLVIASDAVVLSGYSLFVSVLNANRYASRVVEVERTQTVVSTGPYARVRHPMYTAVLVMMLFTPLALASYWAVLPFLLLIPMLVLRIQNEENVLREQLSGYSDYCARVQSRLVPGIW